jgi:hypothetical protein
LFLQIRRVVTALLVFMVGARALVIIDVRDVVVALVAIALLSLLSSLLLLLLL